MLNFSSPLWRYSAGKGSWYFVTLPREDSEFVRWIEEKTVVGFGFIRVEVTVLGRHGRRPASPPKKKNISSR